MRTGNQRGKRAPRQIRGDYGENITAEYLIQNGYQILDRQWRCRYGELDIIVSDAHGVICFVEVKLRRVDLRSGLDSTGTRPGDSVGYRKQKRLRLAASAWLDEWRASRPGYDPPARFDVAEVYIYPDDSFRVAYIPNAFE